MLVKLGPRAAREAMRTSIRSHGFSLAAGAVADIARWSTETARDALQTAAQNFQRM